MIKVCFCACNLLISIAGLNGQNQSGEMLKFSFPRVSSETIVKGGEQGKWYCGNLAFPRFRKRASLEVQAPKNQALVKNILQVGIFCVSLHRIIIIKVPRKPYSFNEEESPKVAEAGFSYRVSGHAQVHPHTGTPQKSDSLPEGCISSDDFWALFDKKMRAAYAEL